MKIKQLIKLTIFIFIVDLLDTIKIVRTGEGIFLLKFLIVDSFGLLILMLFIDKIYKDKKLKKILLDS
jgi:hypothetical protein